MGPRAGLNGRKISSPPGFDPGSSSASQSLYQLSYPAHILSKVNHTISNVIVIVTYEISHNIVSTNL